MPYIEILDYKVRGIPPFQVTLLKLCKRDAALHFVMLSRFHPSVTLIGGNAPQVL